MPQAATTTTPPVAARDSLVRWLAACLAEELALPADELPLQAAKDEGVLPWLAWRLQESGWGQTKGNTLPQGLQEELRQALRHWGLMHLDCEAELERLVMSAAQRSLRLLAFKGHSVARTLYPHPACRPTSDFDLLIDPSQVNLAREWIADMGYSPLQAFAGTLWLGAQSWSSTAAGQARFHVDLHWDYTNRMYFRHRLGFAKIWAAARGVPCGNSVLRVPCPADELILACVHLAAFNPGTHVRLNWLLDIYLLLAALDEASTHLLLARAAEARALEACLVFGVQAAELGDAGNDVDAAETGKLSPVLNALRRSVSESRARGYQRTLRWRAWDLACYWARLPAGDKLHFFADMARWVRVR